MLPEYDGIFFEDIVKIEMNSLLEESEKIKKKEGNKKMSKNKDEFVLFKNEKGTRNYFIQSIGKSGVYHDEHIDNAIKFDDIELTRLLAKYVSKKENTEYRILKRVCTFEEVE